MVGLYVGSPDFGYLGIDPNSAKLNALEVYGTYFNVLPCDIEDTLKRAIDCGPPNGTIAEYHYDKIIQVDPNPMGPRKYGESAEFTPVASGPTKMIIATAENIEATERNSYSNYTANPIDAMKGKSPIGDIILNGGSDNARTFDPATRRRFMELLCPSIPKIHGHEVIYYSAYPSEP